MSKTASLHTEQKIPSKESESYEYELPFSFSRRRCASTTDRWTRLIPLCTHHRGSVHTTFVHVTEDLYTQHLYHRIKHLYYSPAKAGGPAQPSPWRAGLYNFEKPLGKAGLINYLAGPVSKWPVKLAGSLTCPHPSPSRPYQPSRLPCRCKLSITHSPDLTLASPVGELIIFNMQIAELCFGLCQQ